MAGSSQFIARRFQMKMVAKGLSVLFLGSALCLAETYSGRVVDAACKARAAQPGTPQNSPCEPTASTVSFGIETQDGKVLNLDSTGNAKAAEAVKANAGKTGLQATVTGSMDGQTLKVESIDFK
jgi:hypothetical protein